MDMLSIIGIVLAFVAVIVGSILKGAGLHALVSAAALMIVVVGTFAAIEFVTEMFIASVAHGLSAWLGRVGQRFNQACGGVFIAIGALLPLRD